MTDTASLRMEATRNLRCSSGERRGLLERGAEPRRCRGSAIKIRLVREFVGLDVYIMEVAEPLEDPGLPVMLGS
jgi:hypothetical protein